jgi:hypothetical protein
MPDDAAVIAVDKFVDDCIWALRQSQPTGVLHLVDAAGLQNSAGMREARPKYKQRADADLVEYFHRLYPDLGLETPAEAAGAIFVVKDRANMEGICTRRDWDYTVEALPHGSGLRWKALLYLCEYQNVHLPPEGQLPSRCRNEDDTVALHALCQVDDLVLQHIVGFAAARIRYYQIPTSIVVHSSNGVYERLSGPQWQDPLWKHIPPPLLSIVWGGAPRGRQFALTRASLAAFLLTHEELYATQKLKEAGALRRRSFPFKPEVLAELDSFQSRPWQLVRTPAGIRAPPLSPAARSELLRAHLRESASRGASDLGLGGRPRAVSTGPPPGRSGTSRGALPVEN